MGVKEGEYAPATLCLSFSDSLASDGTSSVGSPSNLTWAKWSSQCSKSGNTANVQQAFSKLTAYQTACKWSDAGAYTPVLWLWQHRIGRAAHRHTSACTLQCSVIAGLGRVHC